MGTSWLINFIAFCVFVCYFAASEFYRLVYLKIWWIEKNLKLLDYCWFAAEFYIKFIAWNLSSIWLVNLLLVGLYFHSYFTDFLWLVVSVEGVIFYCWNITNTSSPYIRCNGWIHLLFFYIIYLLKAFNSILGPSSNSFELSFIKCWGDAIRYFFSITLNFLSLTSTIVGLILTRLVWIFFC